jgi:hypothetical protein
MLRISLLLALIAALAACSAAPAQVTPTPASVRPPVPTDVPPTSAPPTPVAVTAVVGASALPAPLLLLERGQISRIEADGVTRSRITEETTELEGLLPITEFVVSPANGDLIYIVGDLEVDRLVRTDPQGQAATTLFAQPRIELSDLVVAPGGLDLALRLLNNNEQPGNLPSGSYLLAANGSGPPRLLIADDPVDDQVNPSRALRTYAPLSFAPDGARLLLRGDSAFYDGCRAIVLPLGANAQPVELSLGEGLVASCTDPSWQPDGLGLLLLGEPADLASGPAGLYRADAASGQASALLPPGALPSFTVARAPFTLSDGRLAALVGSSPAPPPAFTRLVEIPLALVAISPGGAPQPLRAGTIAPFVRGLWAPDGAGLVVQGSGPEGQQTLTYLPAAEQPALALPVTGDNLEMFQWGR